MRIHMHAAFVRASGSSTSRWGQQAANLPLTTPAWSCTELSFVEGPTVVVQDVKMSAPFLDELPTDPETKNALRQVHYLKCSCVSCKPRASVPA